MTDTPPFMPGDRILVRVTPKASRNEVVVESAQEGAPPKLRVYITTVPEDGKANKATIALLSKFLKVPKSRLTLICGHTSRDKIFQLS